MTRPSVPDKDMVFITRMPEPSYKGWRVWVIYGDFDSGQLYFGDSAHGGEDESLLAAKECRDRFVKDNAIPFRVYDGSGHHVQYSGNTTGMVGVHLSFLKKGKYLYARWVATWRDEFKNRHKVFSIGARQGYEAAWWAAVDERLRHSTQERPQFVPTIPEDLTPVQYEAVLKGFPRYKAVA